MESPTCNVIYVDRNVREDRLVLRSARVDDAFNPELLDEERRFLDDNLNLLLDTFGDVHLCGTGASCISTLFNLHDTSILDLKPTLILIDTPYDDDVPEPTMRSRTPSPWGGACQPDKDRRGPDDDLYGLALLQKIFSEAHARNISRLIVPVPVIPYAKNLCTVGDTNPSVCEQSGFDAPFDPPPKNTQRERYLLKVALDLGATDVMRNPMNARCITNLEVHVYKAHRDAAKEQQAIMEVRRGRKRSWVGINEEKPYAYLREAMVSGLMKGICRLGEDADDGVEHIRISASTQRHALIAEAVGDWHFCAHDFSDDELIIAGSVMFKHALAMPELERWRIPTDQLTRFLVACRAAYNSFVPYHNFRHVIDVLQATFSFLVHLGALPAYPPSSTPVRFSTAKSPLSSLITPFEALTLLVTAIGHDVGHPGVNNGFLVKLNAPLAQLYNDRSVLESFHCAAFSQILRRYWPTAFEESKMRNLMISSILATDMGLHFDYMKKMGCTQEKLHENNSTDGWNGRVLEEQRALACALLIKCADISNVARSHNTALQWMHILSDEFSRQASMEKELEIPSALMAPPEKDVLSLSKAQLGFMNMFAIPLFQGVADLMPAMQYCVDELEANKTLFEIKIAEEQSRLDPERHLLHSGTLSPRTMSLAIHVKPTADEGRRNSQLPSAEKDISRISYQEFVANQPSPTNKPSHIPEVANDCNAMNRLVTDFDSVADFAASDPFHMNEEGKYSSREQRRSETTEGSTSAPSGGDRASQLTSTTSGKMPLSPSTQGTSVVSLDSVDRLGSLPITTIMPPNFFKSASHPMIDSQIVAPEDESFSSSTTGKLSDDTTLRKKTSRFRMNAFTLFRRHRNATSPTLSAADSG